MFSYAAVVVKKGVSLLQRQKLRRKKSAGLLSLYYAPFQAIYVVIAAVMCIRLYRLSGRRLRMSLFSMNLMGKGIR